MRKDKLLLELKTGVRGEEEEYRKKIAFYEAETASYKSDKEEIKKKTKDLEKEHGKARLHTSVSA